MADYPEYVALLALITFIVSFFFHVVVPQQQKFLTDINLLWIIGLILFKDLIVIVVPLAYGTDYSVLRFLVLCLSVFLNDQVICY